MKTKKKRSKTISIRSYFLLRKVLELKKRNYGLNQIGAKKSICLELRFIFLRIG